VLQEGNLIFSFYYKYWI